MAGAELKKIAGFSQFAVVCLIITICTYAFSILIESTLFLMGPPVPGSKSLVHGILGLGLIGMSALHLLLLFTTAFALCQWMYRGYNNLVISNTSGLNFKPADAITYWFIPIVNLVRPFCIMKDLYFASDPSEQSEDPKFQKRKSPSVFIIWWTCWILAGICGELTLLFKGHYQLIMANAVASAALTITAAKCLMTIIQETTQRLQTKIPQLKTLD